MFAEQSPSEKHRLLKFVVSNSTWKSGELAINFRQLFAMIAEIIALAAQQNV
jgi:hypothetical protein